MFQYLDFPLKFKDFTKISRTRGGNKVMFFNKDGCRHFNSGNFLA